MIKEIEQLLKPVNLRFDACYWSACDLYAVTVRDGGVTLIEVQGPDLEKALADVLERARAMSKKPRKAADLLG